MVKVVYNSCHGGFGLSEKAVLRYAELKGLTLYPEPSSIYSAFGLSTYWLVPPEKRVADREAQWFQMTQEERIAYNKQYSAQTFSPRDISRHDPVLVRVVEEMGEEASARLAKLKVDDVAGQRYRIDEYDGAESVETPETYDWVTVE